MDSIPGCALSSVHVQLAPLEGNRVGVDVTKKDGGDEICDVDFEAESSWVH